MIHLAIDAVGIKHRGGATVLLDFLDAALNHPRISRITVFCSPQATRRFDFPSLPKLQVIEQPVADRSYIARLWWSQISLTHRCQRLVVDVMLAITGIGRISSGLPYVTFIQQSLSFSREGLQCYGFRIQMHLRMIKELMRLSCRSARHVLVQTPTMQRWVSQQLNIPLARVSVILPSVHLGSFSSGSEADSVSNTSSAPIILYVGNTEPYKNVERIVKGLQILRRDMPSVELHLTWPPDHPICQRPGVKCLGFLAKEQLIQAYRQAMMLVMPSLVETVGLPMLEAMSLGIPVLAADRPYAHDICEDAALFFDPLSPEDFALKAQQMLSSAELRDQLISRGHSLARRRAQATPYVEMVEVIISSVKGRNEA